MFDHIQFTLIHGPNISGSYAIPFFTASDLTSTTRHTDTWALLPLWPSRFVLTGATSKCPPLFPSSILDTFQPAGLVFWCCVFLPFHTVHGILQARILEWFSISSSIGPHFVRTYYYDVSWVVLHGMAHSFIGLHKPFCHDKALVHQGVISQL